jgi:hypothetical protein
MKPSWALAVGAVWNFGFGLAVTLAPAQLLSLLGLTFPSEAFVPMRDAGIVSMGVGIIDWTARNALGAPLRGILWANIFIIAVDGAVNQWEQATGVYPQIPYPTYLFGLALIMVYALGLRGAARMSRSAPA